MTSRDYLVRAAAHKAPWPANLNMRRILGRSGEEAVELKVASAYEAATNIARRQPDSDRSEAKHNHVDNESGLKGHAHFQCVIFCYNDSRTVYAVQVQQRSATQFPLQRAWDVACFSHNRQTLV